MKSVEELTAFLEEAIDDSAKNRVLDTGEAWSIMREDGVLRADAPPIRQNIESDLLEYGFAVLDSALALRLLDQNSVILKLAFQKVGRVFESVVRNGSSNDPRRGFHRVIGATAYHLGGYAAIAFSLFKPLDTSEQNLNVAEKCLVDLMLRDLNSMLFEAERWLNLEINRDEVLAQNLVGEDAARNDAYSRILISGVCRALANYEFALRTGERQFVEVAAGLLSASLNVAEERGYTSLWWVIRMTQHLLDDLWAQSLHQVIPPTHLGDENALYADYRRTFIASLFTQSTAQIELWPSQIQAARRAADPNDDLVVALPTSAGKTRIAELATLTTLSMGQRVLIVTPLRALSAQTERSFRNAFSPIGASVSSLYGKSGVSAGDTDVLRSSQIVVSTPEKLDFALRSEPEIIGDVGLIVLDEGHLIGPGEREVRYEMLVQRLLKRDDANSRRIVCLSAILPSGEPLDDMTGWIRADAEGEPVRSEWRPTRQRYGTLEWRGQAARLNYDLEDSGPFVSNFIEELQPLGLEKKPYPRNLRDVTLMAAWRFADQGKRSLIYITQANWVDGYGEQACKLVKRGYLNSLLEDPNSVNTAVTIGTEWLGPNHPAVKCLEIGVAVHHGRLPSPFLREVERLLAAGIIKVTASSPTLAQGLNLNAAVLLTPYLVRKGERIPGEEFANVAGRAGRAFVDSEGLILHVMNDKHRNRRAQWSGLVREVKERSLYSGLITVIDRVVKRLIQKGVQNNEEAYEYLANSREPWLDDVEEPDGEPLEDLIAKLDLVVFGLVEALDADAENLPQLLDDALTGSLWARQIDRLKPGVRRMQMIVLRSRARLIWNETTSDQRKGHFAMGVGLDAGLAIDAMADELADYLDQADIAAMQGSLEVMNESLSVIADRMLCIKPFVPDSRNALDGNWKAVLRRWLAGDPVSDIGPTNIGIVEDAFVYRLVWALETIRTRRQASGWTPPDGVIAGAAAACLDTGLPSYRMSMLVRSGLPSRRAAILILREIEAEFFDGSSLRNWLRSEPVATASSNAGWPDIETSELWSRYRDEMLSGHDRAWQARTERYTLADGINLESVPFGFGRIMKDELKDSYWITSVDFARICPMPANFAPPTRELNFVQFTEGSREIEVQRIGPVS